MEGIHIALSAEKIGSLWGLPITNTLITSWVVIAVLLVLAFMVRRNLALVPGKLQTVAETAIVEVSSYMEELLESASLTTKFLPLVLTLFFFIFFSNVLEFAPGVGSVGFFSGDEFIPLFRSVNTDLNVTIALSLIAFITIEVTGVAVLGFLKYAGKFVNFSSVIGFIVGIIELFSEIARLISFSFRLFGNIFAGEVLITVVGAFMPLLLPVPLMAFEMFVGFMQAAIFSLLTLFFIKIAVSEH